MAVVAHLQEQMTCFCDRGCEQPCGVADTRQLCVEGCDGRFSLFFFFRSLGVVYWWYSTLIMIQFFVSTSRINQNPFARPA